MTQNAPKHDLPGIRAKCALKTLEMYAAANAGHIASSLSCLELLVDLCFHRMSDSDKIVLSKGHAAAALYTTLSLSGRLPEAPLQDFYKNGTQLAAHPPCTRKLSHIPFGTGSLGHGLSLAAGLAFSQQYTKKPYNVYTILSDGDCNEGSTWEAALFAAHHNLSNLYVVIDRNKIQGFGTSNETLQLEPLAHKWESFGFETVVCANGHSFACLEKSYQSLSMPQRPKCIIANTLKGNSISFMENTVDWHYLPMSHDQYNQAIIETDFYQVRQRTELQGPEPTSQIQTPLH